MLVILALAGAGAYFLLRDMSGPSVTISPELKGRVGPAQNMELDMSDKSGVQSVTVTVKRGEQSMTVLQQTFGTLETQRRVSFNLKETRLPEGAFELEIKAVDGSYRYGEGVYTGGGIESDSLFDGSNRVFVPHCDVPDFALATRPQHMGIVGGALGKLYILFKRKH